MAMLSALPSVQAATSSLAAPANSQQVFFVGNNWDGTVTVIRPSGDFGKIGVINMIPDRKERLKEIHLNPIKLIAYTYSDYSWWRQWPAGGWYVLDTRRSVSRCIAPKFRWCGID